MDSEKGNPRADERMAEALRYIYRRIWSDRPYSGRNPQHVAFKRFARRYAAMAPEEVSWAEVCDRGNGKTWPLWYGLALVVVLLKRGLYSADHAEALYGLKDCFEDVAFRENPQPNWAMCGHSVESLVALPRNKGRVGLPTFVRMETGSNYLKGVIAGFLQDDAARSWHPSQKKVDVLLRSFGEDAETISSHLDFTASLFWRQVHFIRSEFENDRIFFKKAAAVLRKFYLYVVDHHSDGDPFASSTSLSDDLLRSQALTRYILEGHRVTLYTPGMDPGEDGSIVLILRGYESFSTRLKAEDHILLNLSSLECPLYRREILAFRCSTPARLVSRSSSLLGIEAPMQLLYEAKTAEGYPNPSLDRISAEEAWILREWLASSPGSPSTAATKIDALRSFFRWEQEVRGGISLDELAIEQLSPPAENPPKGGSAIPDDELSAIAGRLANKAKAGGIDELVYAIFSIALATEFRISQICGLEVDCIKPTVKPGRYVIHSPSKTSGGEKDDFVITEETRRILLSAIDATESLRLECTAGRLERYIFLARDNAGQPKLMTAGRFGKKMKECCRELGMKRSYTAENLRDTHMTKALERAFREGDGKMEAAILSGHKRMATTMGNYLDVELEKMLEATYGVIIGDSLEVDADGRVVEAIPEKAVSRESVVEEGCGHCVSGYCAVTSPLPCLVCDSFVTTVEHEPFFLRAIEAIDAQMDAASTRHDKEDLLTIKRLHVMYLKAIYKKKEEESRGECRLL